MAQPTYQHKFWLQDSGPHSGKYRLQVFEPDKRKDFIYLMQWNFERVEELLALLGEFFPESQPADVKQFVTSEISGSESLGRGTQSSSRVRLPKQVAVAHS